MSHFKQLPLEVKQTNKSNSTKLRQKLTQDPREQDLFLTKRNILR